MERIEKTVFLSYRRTNIAWALAIFHNLTHHGYDVFFDFNGIASGDFERVIVGNITSRAHFLLVLTPSALERCSSPTDWLRREIETAMDHGRNIVPLMLEGFDFGSPAISSQLTGRLAALRQYNGVNVPPDYFTEAMDRLRSRHLNVPLTAVLHPASVAAQKAASDQKVAAIAAPVVQEKELTAAEWFERGYAATDPDERIRFYTEAIRLKPDFAIAFHNRGLARYNKGDYDGALQDYTEAIRLKPDYADAFYSRGLARYNKGDYDGALQDYTEAIRLKPDYADALYSRGLARYKKGDYYSALQDYTEAIRLKPDYANAFCGRGLARYQKGDSDGALQDCTEAIRLRPDFVEAFNNRGNARHGKGDFDAALRDYTEAIRLKPDDALAFNNRAIARRAKGDVAGAEADEAEAKRLGYQPQ